MMNTEKLVSIIVPIYNVEDYLEECIDSILNQTYVRYEVILVDDGSTDKCSKICDRYAENDLRVKVIHKQNGGLSDARNAGIDSACGEYITFIDSDDYVDADYLKVLVLILERENADIVQGQYTFQRKLLGTGKNQVNCLSSDESLRNYLLFKKVLPSVCMKLYRTTLFENIRFPKGRINEDTCTTYKLLLQAKKYVCIERHLYYYRIRQSSIMHSGFSPQKIDILNIPDEIRTYLGKKERKYREELAYYELRIRFYVYNILLRERQEAVYKSEIEELREKIITTGRLKYIDVKYLVLKCVLKHSQYIYKYILLHVKVKEK